MQKVIRRRESTVQLSPEFHTFPPLLQRIYAHRSVQHPNELDYTLKQLSRPDLFKGLPVAIEVLVQAIEEGKRIMIVGDFDADGATSSSVAMLALRAMGAAWVDYLVPNRFEFGYGLTPEIVRVAAQSSPDVIITVDNGISSIDGVDEAKRLGMQVVVTDHHLPGESLPEADAIVNPNQPGCAFPSKNLAGVGVIFYVMNALRGALRERGWFQSQYFQSLQLPEPNMGDFLDLVALGTVADVVPLDANNRVLVHQGLQRMRAGRMRPGIRALLEVAKRDPERIVAADLGFAVGPRLNAAGRLDDMSIGIRCLTTDDPYEAQSLAETLHDLNQDRRSIETSMQKEALASLAALGLEDADAEQMPWGLCLYDANWHQGVIGILASRIKDKFHRPVIAFAPADLAATSESQVAEQGDFEIKGSARSIPGLHIRDALAAVDARHPGLIKKFGGHAMAAGLSLRADQFETFQQAFDREVRAMLDEKDLTATLLTDGELRPNEFSLPLAHQLRQAGPWGQQFPEPLFDGEFLVVQQRIVGEKHLKMVLAHPDAPQNVLDAIAFNVDTTVWPDPSITRVHVAYQLDVNVFRGRESVQLMINHLSALK
ncbi:single-stranded-DNA-specific exonuclease RecJ [Marinibactrum halimedae]|uniref:Single-stranded-DNA-specific exonuclease RecJ n=1 Tax=Marinibactrum halimedae TaxID=1444977 RepID=A0AA37T8E5_9GAMM|nr:single-stranded-DNA-specific exonuclease RecJ [Marinibactrum halimedae]MCD9461065.1 single-stranded-DNA-specific exonuclease RecJ [Marinibactrum halimedae]GLS26732.1 single-stranded-DNA-specific exonuclease RecJ [Marinibactrum halimedae]